MKNKEVADIFYEIADLLEMKDVEWKPRAYRKAARNIESLSQPIEEIHEKGELKDIDGVGEAISEKISEYLETGELEYYNDLKDELPVDVDTLGSIEGIGPKTVKKLYTELEIKTLDDLEKAAKEGKIAEIEGFGEKTQENILKHIDIARKGQERMLLGKVFPIAESVRQKLNQSEYFENVEIVGSFRRRKPTVGDIDILATSPFIEKAMEEFCKMDDVKEVLEKGETKSSIIASGGLSMDLRIVDKSSFGAALMYFTGSQDHNVTLRNFAIDKGYKLNEYGLFENGASSNDNNGNDKKDGKMVAGKTEKQVYEKLGLDYIPPELREDTGEVKVASKGKLPDLVKLEDIKGDLQMHTDYSDGNFTVKEMAEKADEIGHEYILITDHGPSLHVAGGPESKERLKEQAEEIKEANDLFNVEVLHGIEANITEDGIDVSEDMLDMLDIVVVAMHDRPQNSTERILNVFEDYPVDIFAHPLNRRINKRESADLDMARIVSKAKDQNVALEINSQPSRLDLPWDLVKKHRENAKFVISTDAHTTGDMDYIHLGVAQARKGWLEKGDILNTRELDSLMSYLK